MSFVPTILALLNFIVFQLWNMWDWIGKSSPYETLSILKYKAINVWVLTRKFRRAGTIWKLCEPKQRESGNRTALHICLWNLDLSFVSCTSCTAAMHDITQLWGMCIIGKEEEEGRGFGGVTPEKFLQLCNFANLHSEPFPGQNDLQNYMQSWTWVWAKFSSYHVWCMVWYSLVIISSIGSPMFTWLSSF